MGVGRLVQASDAVIVAALFVETGGAYFGLDDVDPWDITRDARQYAGPHPVVAHPPCSTWCQLAKVNEARYGHAARPPEPLCRPVLLMFAPLTTTSHRP